MPYLSRSLVGFHPASTEDADQLKDVELGDKVEVVIVGGMGDNASRSQKQNGLAFLWYKERGKYRGETIEQERAFCKLHYGVPILRAESETFRRSYDSILKPLNYEDKLQAVEDFDLPVTRLMTTKQFAYYLDTVDMESAKLGLVLSKPDDLYHAALGRERR